MPIAGPPLSGPFDLAKILKRGLDTNADADALVSRRRRWTWRMLDSASTRLAGSYLDLWFHGRKKQIIVHDGSNICPQEVEAALLEHVAVTSVGVVGIQSALHGENVRAYVTLDASAVPPTMQDLIQFARARVGYKAPEEVIVLGDMPLNATGKVDRVSLKRMAADAGATTSRRAPSDRQHG